jgi:hypothetical protein
VKLYEYALKVVDKGASAALGKVNKAAKGADASTSKLSKTAKKAGGNAKFFDKLGDSAMDAAGQIPFVGSALTTLTGPIGWVVAAIGGLVAGMVMLVGITNDVRAEQQQLQQIFGVTGKALQEVTVQERAMAKVFKKDTEELAVAANNFGKAFGLNAADSLKLVEQGFVAGADASGEFIAQLREYGPQFQSAGLTAKQAIAFMSQTPKLGIFTDKGADVIKEATLRLKEMPKAAQDALKGLGLSSVQIQKDLNSGAISSFDAIQKVSKAMAGASVQARQTAIADIFAGPGEDAGEKFLLQLGQMDLNLDNINKQAAKLNPKLNKQLSIEKQLAAEQVKFAAAFTGVASMFDNALSIVQLYAMRVVNFFTEMIQKSVLLQDYFKAMGSILTFNIRMVWQGFQLAYQGAEQLLNLLGFNGDNPFGQFFHFLDEMWVKAKLIFSQIVDVAIKSSEVLGNALQGNLTAAATNGADLIKMIQGVGTVSDVAVVDARRKALGINDSPASQLLANSGVQAPSNALPVPGGASGSTSSPSVQSGIEAVNGGGSKSVNVTVNIGSLVETMNNHYEYLDEGLDELGNKINEHLLRVTNGALFNVTA